MKLMALISLLVLGLTLTSTGYTNDINLSWSARSLRGQALYQSKKIAAYRQNLINRQNQAKYGWRKFFYRAGLKEKYKK